MSAAKRVAGLLLALFVVGTSASRGLRTREVTAGDQGIESFAQTGRRVKKKDVDDMNDAYESGEEAMEDGTAESEDEPVQETPESIEQSVEGGDEEYDYNAPSFVQLGEADDEDDGAEDEDAREEDDEAQEVSKEPTIKNLQDGSTLLLESSRKMLADAKAAMNGA
mmetsp:Transcript_55372/g.124992  ORF Transcript_55372/g.124992 Transcript_55372/m.124992 type:complete len:166 (-) Transcript_55372:99-596(-)